MEDFIAPRASRAVEKPGQIIGPPRPRDPAHDPISAGEEEQVVAFEFRVADRGQFFGEFGGAFLVAIDEKDPVVFA